MPAESFNLLLGALYIRESTTGQDAGFSPAKQEKDIREYAKRNNIKIVALYKDLVSGRTAAKRPDFLRMIEDAKKGLFSKILVFHSSRFARNAEEARRYKRILKGYGVSVVSVTQLFGDPANPSTRLNEGINELIDEQVSENISFWMKHALMEKREQGYAPGNPPLGYFRKTDNKKDWFVDPKEERIINEMYRLYATGKHSMKEVANILNSRDYKTKLGNPFTYSSIKCHLINRAYLGEIVSGIKGVPNRIGKHKPIIIESLFNKVQAVMMKRRGNYGRPVAQHRFYLLQGVVYCHACIAHLKGREDILNPKMVPKMRCYTQITKNGTENYFYGCKFKHENKGCSQKDSPCHVIDEQILNYMNCFQFPEDLKEKVLQKLEKMLSKNKLKPPQNNKEKLKKLKEQKSRLDFMFHEAQSIDREEYLEKLKDVQLKIKMLEGDSADNTLNLRGINQEEALNELRSILDEFQKFWSLNLTDQDRRSWILMMIKRIWIKDKKVVAIEPQERFKEFFHTTKKVIARRGSNP